MLLMLEILVHLYKYASKKNKKIDWVVAELSSYQIEISPEVNLILESGQPSQKIILKDIKHLKTISK